MPTVSIRETLARLPGGFKGTPRTWAEVSSYIWNNYLKSEAEETRVRKFAERQRLYLGSGEQDVLAMIDKVFQDKDVKELRKQWVEFAKYNNVIRRVIHEQATVYSMPAVRSVDGDENNERYQKVLELCRFHEVMQRFNALLLLNRATVIVPRMRELPDGQWVPTIDLVTPSKMHAVRDPIDPTLCISLIFQTDLLLADTQAMGPSWEMLTWHERAWLNSRGQIMPEDKHGNSLIEEHGFGRIPAILATIDPPDGKLLDESTGDELVAAQKAVTFLQILMLKEAKSSTKQTYIQGDTARAQFDQPDDTERAIRVGDGVQVQTLDRSMDFLAFGACADNIAVTTASNFGIAPEVLKNGSVASADARELTRVPLRERRLQQHVPLRAIERELAELLSVVVAQRRPDLAFSVEGWNIDFADPQTPLGTSEALDVLRKELELGLTSELKAIMDRNPDLSYAQAKAVLVQLIHDRTFRMEHLREFAVMSGGMAQSANTMRDVPATQPDSEPSKTADQGMAA
jgi:hypothetical protein